jgi:hypothetical protein
VSARRFASSLTGSGRTETLNDAATVPFVAAAAFQSFMTTVLDHPVYPACDAP